MQTPLSSDWTVDRTLLAESSDWITGREPRILRLAPIVGLAVLAALVAAAYATHVDAPVPVAVSVVQQRSASDSLELVLASPRSETPFPAGDHAAALRLQEPRQSRVTRVLGRVARLGGNTAEVEWLRFTAPDAPADCCRGAGVLLVFAERVSLASVLKKMLNQGT